VAACCLSCGGAIPEERMANGLKAGKPTKYCCRKCNTKAGVSRHYQKHRERVKAKVAAARKPYGEWTPEQVARSKALKRKYREQEAAAQGRELLPPNRAKTFDQQQSALVESNAKQAWAWWLKTCPDWWLRAYHRALGKPWNNPRVAPADKWRIRYWLDPAFRAKEIEKVQTLKVRRAARIAANNDGTLTGEVIVGLFAKARDCPYCLKRMRSVEKSLDHVEPLSKGGAHSVLNVVVCCKDCNTRKGVRSLPRSMPAQLIHG
jgi:5-methylcytosine-specific restriction endonuclease McrA